MEQIQQASGRSEYAIAFRSIKTAKNLAATLIVLCILAQIGAAVAVHFIGVLDELPVGASQAPQTLPAATQPSVAEIEFAVTYRNVMQYALPAARFAALVLCLLLVLMVMFAVKLSLVERIGGVAGFISAFNWSLILLLMLVPWRPILSSSLSCGALFNFTELTLANSALGDAPGQIDLVGFYIRFIAYPCVALFTCLIVQVKFAKGYSAVDFQLDELKQDAASSDPVVPPME